VAGVRTARLLLCCGRLRLAVSWCFVCADVAVGMGVSPDVRGRYGWIRCSQDYIRPPQLDWVRLWPPDRVGYPLPPLSSLGPWLAVP
jgi:hypothetical protein